MWRVNDRKWSRRVAQIYAAAEPHSLVAEPIRDHPLTISCGTNRRCMTLQRVDTTVGKFATIVDDYQPGIGKDGPGHVLGAFKGERRLGDDALCVSGMGLDNDNMISRVALDTLLAASKFFTITVSTFKDGRRRQIEDPERFTRRARKQGRSIMPDDAGGQQHFGAGYRNVRFCGEVEYEGVLQYEFRHEAETRSRTYLLFARPLEGELLQALLNDPIAFGLFYRYGETVLGLHDMDALCFEPARFHYGPLVPGSDLRAEMEISDDHRSRTSIAGRYLIDMVPVAHESLKRAQELAASRRDRRRTNSVRGTHNLVELRNALSAIPADCDYGTWFKCLCAIFYETDASEEGRQLAHEWSSGDTRYDERQVDRIWDSLRPDRSNPTTMGSLIYIARHYEQDRRCFSP